MSSATPIGPKTLPRQQIDSLTTSIRQAQDRVVQHADQAPRLQAAGRELGDRFDDPRIAGLVETMAAFAGDSSTLKADYTALVRDLREAQQKLNAAPDYEAWYDTLRNAEDALGALGDGARWKSGFRRLKESLGEEGAQTVVSRQGAQELLVELGRLEQTPEVWKLLDQDAVAALRPALEAHVEAGRAMVRDVEGLLKGTVAVDKVFPDLELPQGMKGLTLQETLAKAAEALSSDKSLVPLEIPVKQEVLSRLLRGMADKAGQTPVDWRDRGAVWDGSGPIQRLINGVEELGSRLAPQLIRSGA